VEVSVNNELPRLSRAEWTLMNLCWKLGKATAREVFDIASKRKDREYRTIKTLLDRIAAKGYLKVDKIGPIRQYTPMVERSAVLRNAIEDFVVNVLDSSVAPVLVYLADSKKIDEQDLSRLKQLVEEVAKEEELAP
jgi:BlaI family penicillinase repressor